MVNPLRFVTITPNPNNPDMNKLAFSLACALSAASSHAANIAFVSFHTENPSAAAVGAGQGYTADGPAPDAGYTDLLRNAGHTVTRFTTINDINTSATAAGFLNGFDLVILGRSVDSSHYGSDAETAFWNSTITAPAMILSGYVLRGGDTANGNNRLGYTTGSTMADTTGNVTLNVLDANHPIFQGITLGGGNTLTYAVPVSTPIGTAQRGISVNTNPVFTGGTVLATDGTLNGMVIGEWQAGTAMNTAVTTGPQDVLGGHRMIFLTGSRENSGGNSQTAGIYDLSPDGAQAFLNAVSYMAVPEPSTYALLGFGGLALLFRRKRV